MIVRNPGAEKPCALALRISCGHFCLPVFFDVTHDGLSEGGATRSLGCFGYLLSQITRKGLLGTFRFIFRIKRKRKLNLMEAEAKDQRYHFHLRFSAQKLHCTTG